MVDTQPHGTGDVNDHLNPEYDPDEDGLVELLELDRDLTTDTGVVVYDYAAGEIVDGVIPDVDSLSYSGEFADAQIPDIDTLSYTGTLDDAVIPDVDSLSYSGEFADAQIPDIDTLSYTNELDDAVIPDVDTLSYSSTFDLAQLPDLVDHTVAHTPTDLSGSVGAYDGQQAVDDGTNTSARGVLCIWDDVNSVWRPSDDPSAGAFS